MNLLKRKASDPRTAFNESDRKMPQSHSCPKQEPLIVGLEKKIEKIKVGKELTEQQAFCATIEERCSLNQEKLISTMPPRKSTSIKGTDDKAAFHVQNTVARETVDRDSIQQLIAFASTILVYPIESRGRLFDEE